MVLLAPPSLAIETNLPQIGMLSPGQHGGAGLGDDRTAEGALGDARGPGASPREAMPAGSDRAGLYRPHDPVPRLRRCRHVHRQQLHGRGGIDLRAGDDVGGEPVTSDDSPGDSLVLRRIVLPITRSELVARLASSADVSERDAGVVVGTVLEAISKALARGGRIELRGFGVFSVRQRDARKARNPRTGEAVHVKARKTVHFKAGRQLQKVLNSDPEALAILRDRREAQCRRRDERRGQLRLL